MNVNKLTLTSIVGRKYKVIIDNPNSDIATTLIKERLNSRNGIYNSSTKVPKKLPAALKGLVNPACRVEKYNKINIDA